MEAAQTFPSADDLKHNYTLDADRRFLVDVFSIYEWINVTLDNFPRFGPSCGDQSELESCRSPLPVSWVNTPRKYWIFTNLRVFLEQAARITPLLLSWRSQQATIEAKACKCIPTLPGLIFQPLVTCHNLGYNQTIQ
ncbi:MAG: hypothetical protein QM522_04170 [Chitinophagaceae bacterium]|nr:hypothetical protein [Chitinophagaceae bacterium]